MIVDSQGADWPGGRPHRSGYTRTYNQKSTNNSRYGEEGFNKDAYYKYLKVPYDANDKKPRSDAYWGMPPFYRQLVSSRSKYRRAYPAKKFINIPLERGTDESIARFGRTWYQATDPQRAERAKYQVVGKGAYHSNVGGYGRAGTSGSGAFFDGFKKALRVLAPALRAAGSAGATALGGPMAGAVFNGITGSGEYADTTGFGNATGNLGSLGGAGVDQVHNSLINNGAPTRMIQTMEGDTNAIIVNHTEYIVDIIPTSTGFQTQVFLSVNPGLPDAFPWLNNVASFYEEYKMLQLIYTFKSMVCEGNATAGGTLIMCAQYNPGNPPFTTKQRMENYDYATSCKVTSDCKLGIECDHNKNAGSDSMYVRTGAVPAGQDIKTYDLCTFQLATTGAVANLLVGELWVYYKVMLNKAKIPLPGQTESPIVAAAVFQFSGDAPDPDNPLPQAGLFRYFKKIRDNTSLFFIEDYTNSSVSPGKKGNKIIFPSFITGGCYIISFTMRFEQSWAAGGYGFVVKNVSSVDAAADPSSETYPSACEYDAVNSSGITDHVIQASTPPWIKGVSSSDEANVVFDWEVSIYCRINSPSNDQAVLALIYNSYNNYPEVTNIGQYVNTLTILQTVNIPFKTSGIV